MAGWSPRMMFELYLYDYLRKNNMHQTAETFFREANLAFDASVPTAIDVPDGFLHEWWMVFYDMYTSWQSRDRCPGDVPSMMVEQITEARQRTDPSPSRQYLMNDQMILRLLTRADSWFNTGVNAVGSTRSPLIGAEQIPPGISSSSKQQDLLASTSTSNLPGNVANLTCQGVGFSVVAAPRKDDNMSEESSGESMKTSDSIGGNNTPAGDANSTEESSLMKSKYSNDNAKSSSHANGNENNAGSSSSKLPGCATTADDLIDEIVFGGIHISDTNFDNLVDAKFVLSAAFMKKLQKDSK